MSCRVVNGIPRAVFVADIEDGPELLKGQQAHGHLDADHLHTWLPLSVDTSGQPEAAEAFLIDLALLEQEDSAVQVKNVPLNNGVVDFIDERKHVECWVVSQKKRPPEWEALVESNVHISRHDTADCLPFSVVGQQQQHGAKQAFVWGTIPQYTKPIGFIGFLKKSSARPLAHVLFW